MKARSSIQTEIDVELTTEEISGLEKEVLSGKLQIRNDSGILLHLRDIELLIGQIKFNTYIDLQSFPEKADFLNIIKYIIILSESGYRILKRDGFVIDRINESGKVAIYRKGHPWTLE